MSSSPEVRPSCRLSALDNLEPPRRSPPSTPGSGFSSPPTLACMAPPEIVSKRLVVGLEVHVELATRTKMFSRAPNPAYAGHFDAEPNTLIDPVVLGLPGALPVLNRAAIEMAMTVGVALGCSI